MSRFTIVEKITIAVITIASIVFHIIYKAPIIYVVIIGVVSFACAIFAVNYMKEEKEALDEELAQSKFRRAIAAEYLKYINKGDK
jgi:5-bromo-4-chloroindolyl phosphate hydrolysis protein